jgi:arabinose-5-phosphate isomerase
MDYLREIERVIQTEIEELQSLKNRNRDVSAEIISAILSTKGKLIITGMGKSGHIAKKIASTMSSLGTASFYLHPGEAYHGDLGMIGKEDAIMAISNSGETEELLRLISFIKIRGNLLISLTGNSKSTLAANSNFHIDVSVSKEACPHQLAPTSSTTNVLVMGDALAVTLSLAKKFQPEDFALFHPGGSLGKKLLSRVRDFMKKDDLPCCQPTTSLIDVIQVISKGRTGLAVVVKDDKILGIITDGDIRRSMEAYSVNFFKMSAEDIMTPNPKTIDVNEKLVIAEKILNDYKITSLVVVSNQKLAGLIQVYDI